MTDAAEAEALRLAKQHLEKMGWKYTPEDIGNVAAEMLNALYGNRSKETNNDR